MLIINRLVPVCAIVACMLANVSAARGQMLEPDPAAMKAFGELVSSYRAKPGLKIKSTVQVEMMDGDVKSSSSEVSGEFIFSGKDQERRAVVKLRGFTCYLANGEMTAVHDENEDSYFTTPDDGSPYYALLLTFMDLPFPELALMLGEESVEDVVMQFHPKAPWIQPTAVEMIENDGKSMQKLTLASEHDRLELLIDPQSKLINSMELVITGGDLVQDGVTLIYRNSYEYEVADKPLDEAIFTFDPGERRRVDLMAMLLPEPADADDDGMPAAQAGLIGKPAPNFVLTTADGRAIDLADLQGRVVVLDFWASWCGPCMHGLPLLHQAASWASQEQLPVTVLTVNVWEIQGSDNTPEARLESARNTWKKRGFTLPILMDYTDDTTIAYGLRGIPTTVIIRSDGIVHNVHVGAADVETLKNDIRSALEAVESGV